MLSFWCNLNKMIVNVEKTKFINFGDKRFEFSNPIIYHTISCSRLTNCVCQNVEQVDRFKYLGLLFDQRMSWEHHVSELNNKLNYGVRKFYFLRNFCDVSLLRTLYFALVQSRLQYGIACWGSTSKYLIDRLRTTQNHYLPRIIMKKQKRESSYPIYVNLKILPIQNLFIFKVLKVFFTMSGNNQTTDFYYRTRSVINNSIKPPEVQKEKFRRSINYLDPKIFNNLPPEIKHCNKKHYFIKKTLRLGLNLEDISFLICVVA